MVEYPSDCSEECREGLLGKVTLLDLKCTLPVGTFLRLWGLPRSLMQVAVADPTGGCGCARGELAAPPRNYWNKVNDGRYTTVVALQSCKQTARDSCFHIRCAPI